MHDGKKNNANATYVLDEGLLKYVTTERELCVVEQCMEAAANTDADPTMQIPVEFLLKIMKETDEIYEAEATLVEMKARWKESSDEHQGEMKFVQKKHQRSCLIGTQYLFVRITIPMH